MDNVLRQKDWTDDEFKAAGFSYYKPVKQLVMAKLLIETKAFDVEVETITGKIGDFICYDPGEALQDNPDDYPHWPVRSDIFFRSYRNWDEPDWTPTPPEKHLIDQGCHRLPTRVRAQRLRESRKVQSLESPQPVEVPAGRWLIIGGKGEPYHNTDEAFRERYIVPQDSLRERMYWAALTGLSNLTND